MLQITVVSLASLSTLKDALNLIPSERFEQRSALLKQFHKVPPQQALRQLFFRFLFHLWSVRQRLSDTVWK
jgi:hypothetical protein